ncbi:MAG TPA: polysaccharide lyase family 7 protein [Blastococcus sp.]
MSRTTRRVLVALSAVCMAVFGLAVAPAASAAPSQALDTYKLQLPTATNGKGDEVSRDALVAGYSSTWFQPTADGRGYRFKVPVNGVPGAGTSFPRTELRELNPDGSLAGWAGGDGVTRTFRAVYKINHLPVGDRETTLFQIHNGDTEVTTIWVADAGSQMNVVVRKNGLSLSPKLITNYAYGTRFDIKVVVNTRVKVYLAGVLKFDYPFSDLTIGSGGKFYEKAGNYLQANTVTAAASDYGEIEMRLPVGANHYLVRTGSPTRPAAPVLTAASSPADTTTTTNQVVLDWNNAAGATGYEIHEDLNTLDHVVATVPVSNATFGNPTPGQYEYYVVARNSAGASLGSNKMTCTVPGGPCTKSP